MNNLAGPLIILRWKGAICPCLESGEDKAARRSLEILDGLQVRWYRAGKDSNKSLGGMMSGWFGTTASKDDAVEASLVWIDAEKGPELQIKPQQIVAEDGELSLKKQSVGYIKTIPLKQVDKVVLHDESNISLQAKKENGKYQDLAIIGIIVGDAKEIHDALCHMQNWNTRRLESIPEEDREVDEEVGIRQKAQKAAHFARREIELQQQRRERDKRKAEYVKGSGGLKYTALAMANRSDD
jgi:hypothetical protein